MFEFSKIVLNLHSQNSQVDFFIIKWLFIITIKKYKDEKRNSS